MSYYHDSPYYDHHHHSYQYPSRGSRESRHSHRSKGYIVNQGQLIIDEKTLRNTNAVIYNAPGSTMYLEPAKRRSYHTSVTHSPYHSSTSSRLAQLDLALPTISTCHGCYERREMRYGDYCRDCASNLLHRPSSKRAGYLVDDRRVLDYPERRRIGWY
jgi:hypothetical protein